MLLNKMMRIGKLRLRLMKCILLRRRISIGKIQWPRKGRIALDVIIGTVQHLVRSIVVIILLRVVVWAQIAIIERLVWNGSHVS